MRYCFLSDIHSNLEALKSVIEHSENKEIDNYICLGDIIGYGPRPQECSNIIFDICSDILPGNHEYALLEKIDISDFNKNAVAAIRYTKEQMETGTTEKMFRLEEQKTLNGFQIVHGALTNPVTDYIMNVWIAYSNFKKMTEQICFYGHTHIPLIYVQKNEKKPVIDYFTSGQKYFLKNEYRYLVNVGSIGQPRDKNNKASYCIFDTDEMYIINYRVEYNIKKTQKQMAVAKLPEYLINRLERGR